MGQQLLGPRCRRARAEARPDRAASVVDQDAGAASLGPGLVPGVLVTGVAKVSPLQPSPSQWRSVNWTCSLELVPMPSSRMAVCLSGRNPAPEKSTEERRIENGTARTTLSRVTVRVRDPCLRVRVTVPPPWRTATSCWPSSIWPWSWAASRVGSWSQPPRMAYFSLDGPKMRSCPWPEKPSRPASASKSTWTVEAGRLAAHRTGRNRA